MDNGYSVGQVSRLVGLPAKTIRFYEESGVLSPVGRSDNGYRKYSPEVIEELKLLKYARDLGLPLSEIKKLMKGCGHGKCSHSEQYIETSIDAYLKLLADRILQLQTLQSRLGQLKRSVKAFAETGDNSVFCCDLLHQLVNYAKRKGGECNGR